MDLLVRINKIIENFISKNLRMALAESCTGGFISHMFTNISGASKVFERGIICYSNQAKTELLNIEPKTIDEHGAVSKNVVFQLALNIRKLSNVDVGIGVSGIAGPTGGTQDKPVGLVFIGFSTNKETIVQEYIFKADRITFKSLVLEKIIEYLEKNF